MLGKLHSFTSSKRTTLPKTAIKKTGSFFVCGRIVSQSPSYMPYLNDGCYSTSVRAPCLYMEQVETVPSFTRTLIHVFFYHFSPYLLRYEHIRFCSKMLREGTCSVVLNHPPPHIRWMDIRLAVCNGHDDSPYNRRHPIVNVILLTTHTHYCWMMRVMRRRANVISEQFVVVSFCFVTVLCFFYATVVVHFCFKK